MKEQRSPHVLNASSNLIGFCFLVITSLRFFNKSASTVIDEVATIAMVFFMAAALFSFLSLGRTAKHSVMFERFANILFFVGLVLLFISTLLFSLRFIN